MALYAILFLGSTPIGGPLTGWMAERFGTRWALMMGAVAAVVSGIGGLMALHRRETVLGASPTMPARAVVDAVA